MQKCFRQFTENLKSTANLKGGLNKPLSILITYRDLIYGQTYGQVESGLNSGNWQHGKLQMVHGRKHQGNFQAQVQSGAVAAAKVFLSISWKLWNPNQRGLCCLTC